MISIPRRISNIFLLKEKYLDEYVEYIVYINELK